MPHLTSFDTSAITRNLLAGKGRPVRFQRQGQRKRAKDALTAALQKRCEISRIISPPCQQCLQVMFGPWMLPARGPRRSQRRNPARGGVCCRGQYAAAQVPLWWYGWYGWYDILLASKGRVGMIDKAMEMGSPPCLSRLRLWRTWKGAGVVVGA
jgi:hypothetical protein